MTPVERAAHLLALLLRREGGEPRPISLAELRAALGVSARRMEWGQTRGTPARSQIFTTHPEEVAADRAAHLRVLPPMGADARGGDTVEW